MQQGSDIFVISPGEDLKNVCDAMTADFGYSFRSWRDADALFEGEGPTHEPRIVILSVAELLKKTEIAGHVQVIRQMYQDCFIICIVAKALDQESAEFLKKSGADAVILDDEAVRSSKVQFICSQTLNALYLPIKTSDLTPGAELTFDLYHLLPLRGKFLICKRAGDGLDADKIAKVSSVGEMYIRRIDAPAFNQYTSLHTDKSAAGLARRCRAQFLSLTSSYIELIYHLTNRSEYASVKKGQDLLKQTEEIANSMVTSLGGLGEAWEIINNSAIGTFGSAERAPAIAAYAAIFALQMGVGSITDVMISALLSDLGLLYLDPKITRKLRQNAIGSLTVLERDEYEKHPSISLEVALERKLPLSQEVRSIIACSHERIDGTGFPKKLQGKKVPKISELIQIAEIIDQSTCLRLGRARVDANAFRKDFFAREMNSRRFSIDLVANLKIQ